MAVMRFPPVSEYDTSAPRQRRTVAADLDGTLLASSSAFPYYFLVALEAGSYPRALALLLAAPLILLLYVAVSEAAAIAILVFLTFAGLRVRDVEAVARDVLPRHYAAGVRADTWAVFRGCVGRRVVVTASPAVMVGDFVRDFLGAEVAGTQLETWGCRRWFTGRIHGHVLVGERKREVVQRLFAGGDMPDVGLGDRESDHDFMAVCKEGYMVPRDHGGAAARASADTLLSRAIFHDGRLVRRPDPAQAVLALAYLPVGFLLALFRVFLFHLLLPVRLLRHAYRLTGVRLVVRGTPPRGGSALLVCNRRTALDTTIISAALGRPVTRVVACDGQQALLKEEDGNDVVVFPEGTTCREPFLLRFSAAFFAAELTTTDRRIVPVAVDARQGTYYGSTARGCRWLDPLFFYMNPRPGYEVTFLPALRPEETCAGGGRSAVDVADHVQRVIAKDLGFQCTTLTGNDKYMKLDGTVNNMINKSI